MPDSFRVNQPTLSKNMWMGSLQQRTAGLALPFTVTMGGQHCCPSPHWTSPQLRRAWQAETKHADKRVPVVPHDVLPPPGTRGTISGSPGAESIVGVSCACVAVTFKVRFRCQQACLPLQLCSNHWIWQPLQRGAGQQVPLRWGRPVCGSMIGVEQHRCLWGWGLVGTRKSWIKLHHYFLLQLKPI